MCVACGALHIVTVCDSAPTVMNSVTDTCRHLGLLRSSAMSHHHMREGLCRGGRPVTEAIPNWILYPLPGFEALCKLLEKLVEQVSSLSSLQTSIHAVSCVLIIPCILQESALNPAHQPVHMLSYFEVLFLTVNNVPVACESSVRWCLEHCPLLLQPNPTV